MAYRYFKDLGREQLVIRDYVMKHLILIKIQSVIDINVESLHGSYNFYTKLLGGAFIRATMLNLRPSDLLTRQIAEKLYKPITRKFEKRKSMLIF